MADTGAAKAAGRERAAADRSKSDKARRNAGLIVLMDSAVHSRGASASKWLYAAWAMLGLKLAITMLWSLQHHHAAPRLPHAVQEMLIFVIPFDVVVVYAMFHGWKGWQF